MTDTVEIVNNKFIDDKTFYILRNEGWGYVQNFVEYDKNILNLEKEYIPGNGEGASCQVIYKFVKKEVVDENKFNKRKNVCSDQFNILNESNETLQIKFISNNGRWIHTKYYYVDMFNKTIKSNDSQLEYITKTKKINNVQNAENINLNSNEVQTNKVQKKCIVL